MKSRHAVNVASALVNSVVLDMLRIVGAKGMIEIWFPPYMTSIAPTRMEGAATSMRTPAAHETATMETLMAI